MSTIFKNISFDVRCTGENCSSLVVDTKILYNDNYFEDTEFELMFYYKNGKIIFDEFIWTDFINDYENNISKKIKPTNSVPFGYQGYIFKFNSFIIIRLYQFIEYFICNTLSYFLIFND